MITADGSFVFCNNLPCNNALAVPTLIRTPEALRFHVWHHGWLIDLHAPGASILTSAATDTPADLRRYGTDITYLALDQHYCCVACAEQDT